MRGEGTGRGALLLSAMVAIGTLAGFALHLALGRMLGAADYGRYGFAFSVLIWFELACSQGLPYAAARLVARRPEAARAVAATMARAVLVAGGVLSVALVAAAPLVARVVDDPPIARLLVWSSLDVVPFGLLQVRLLLLNGLKRHGMQTSLYAAYVLGRLALAVVLVGLGAGVLGAVLANAAASAVLAAVAWCVPLARGGDPPTDVERPTLRAAFAAGAPMTAFHVATHVFLHADLWLVGGLLRDETLTGHYVAAQTVARGPYFLSLGVSLALFPAVGEAVARGDLARGAALVREALGRQLVLLPGALAVLLAAPDKVVTALFGDAFLPAASIVLWMLPAYAAAALLQTLAHAVAAARDPRHAAVALGVAAGVATSLGTLLLARAADPVWVPPAFLVGAAGVGVVLLAAIGRAWGPLVPSRRALVPLAAAGLLYALCRVLPTPAAWYVPQAAVLGLLYAAVTWRLARR